MQPSGFRQTGDAIGFGESFWCRDDAVFSGRGWFEVLCRMKKLLLLIFALLLIPVLSFPAATHHAETTALLREKILSMNPSELLSFLLEEGLVLPEDFDVHITEMSEPFVYNKTPLILEGQLDDSNRPYSYTPSNQMLFRIYAIYEKLGVIENG